MPYWDPTLSLRLQARDRLRDLLEADSLVMGVYTGLIGSLAPEGVMITAPLVVSLELGRVPHFGVAAGPATASSGTHFNNASYMLIVQQFASEDASVSQASEYDACANVTDWINLAMLRYQVDPGPTPPGKVGLWDAIYFDSPAVIPEKLPQGFWYTITNFHILSYQPNV